MKPYRSTLDNGMDVWLIPSYEDAKTVLASPKVSKDLRKAGFADEPGDMNHSDPPEHTRLRRLVSRGFTGHRIKALEPWIQELTDELIDRFTNPVDLVAEFAVPLPVTVICELLGVPEEDRAELRARSTKMFDEQVHDDVTAFM